MNIVVNLNIKRKCSFCSEQSVAWFYHNGVFSRTIGHLCEKHRIDFANGKLKV